MKITKGRVVFYYDQANEEAIVAIVAWVHSDGTTVNLTTFSSVGYTGQAVDVPMIPETISLADWAGRGWQWPPRVPVVQEVLPDENPRDITRAEAAAASGPSGFGPHPGDPGQPPAQPTQAEQQQLPQGLDGDRPSGQSTLGDLTDAEAEAKRQQLRDEQAAANRVDSTKTKPVAAKKSAAKKRG